MRLLIVEDNFDNWDMLSRRLQRRGFEVMHAKDGQEGLEMAFYHAPDLVLLDMSLPVLDGWEVARAIRRDSRTERLPVIALTAHAAYEDRQKALDSGCDEFEPKPVDFESLLQKIQDLTQHEPQPM